MIGIDCALASSTCAKISRDPPGACRCRLIEHFRGRRSCRCRPCRTPAAWRRRHRHFPPDDFRHRRDRRRAVGQCSHRLRRRRDRSRHAAACRRQLQRIELAVRRWHHHDDPRHACNPGRNRIHQHRGRTGGGAGHVEPDRIDRAPAQPSSTPSASVKPVLRQLLCETPRSGHGRFQGISWRCRKPRPRHRPRPRSRSEPEASVSSRSISSSPEQGRVATAYVDDGTGGARNIGRNLRLAARNCLNSGPKSALLVSRRTGMVAF